MENIHLFLLCRYYINMPIAFINSIENMYLIFFVTKIIIIEHTSRQEQISSKEELLHDFFIKLPLAGHLTVIF